jgi:hypothetical protein
MEAITCRRRPGQVLCRVLIHITSVLSNRVKQVKRSKKKKETRQIKQKPSDEREREKVNDVPRDWKCVSDLFVQQSIPRELYSTPIWLP